MGKSRKGGYKLVSLNHVELVGMTALAGLYASIVNSHKKPLMLSDIVINGEKKNDIYVTAIKGTNQYTIKGIYGYQLVVTNADAVTISADVESEVSVDGLLAKMEGDNGINVDENEGGDKVAIRLDQDIVNDVNRALKTPVATPTEIVVPLIATNNAQVNAKLGDGLSYDSETDELKVTASGGTKLYKHVLEFTQNPSASSFKLVVINNVATAYTLDNIPLPDALRVSAVEMHGEEYGSGYCVPYLSSINSSKIIGAPVITRIQVEGAPVFSSYNIVYYNPSTLSINDNNIVITADVKYTITGANVTAITDTVTAL